MWDYSRAGKEIAFMLLAMENLRFLLLRYVSKDIHSIVLSILRCFFMFPLITNLLGLEYMDASPSATILSVLPN